MSRIWCHCYDISEGKCAPDFFRVLQVTKKALSKTTVSCLTIRVSVHGEISACHGVSNGTRESRVLVGSSGALETILDY